MRPRTPLAVVLALASPLTTASAHAAPAHPAPAGAAHAPAAPGARPAGPPVPLCAQPDAPSFPLTGHLRGGPGTLRAGDGPSGFTVHIRNTGRVTCHRVHPVLVLVDEARALVPAQLRLDFHDGHRWLPVRLRHTSRNESVGVLDGGKGFRGFTVRPGGSTDVRLRLAVRDDAGADRVAVQAALVQRHDGEGRWVGHSDTYTFTLRAAEGGDTRPPVPPARPPRSDEPARPRDTAPSPARPPAVPVPPSPWPLPVPWATGEPPPASRFPTEVPVPTGRPASPPPSGLETAPASPRPPGTVPPAPSPTADPTGETPRRDQPGDGRDRQEDEPGRSGEEGRPELAETGGSATLLGLLATALTACGAVLLQLARRLRP
ncbi:hypothetical protein [Streptomyces sp. NPDC058374]|uniref:hypothetical protein n=1 Tax=unclassified Streptomyces TaxID=2593676 RepID=UPI00365BC945